MNTSQSFIKLITTNHNNLVSEITMDFKDCVYTLNNLGLKFLHDYWMNYFYNNKANTLRLYGIFDNARVVLDVLKQDIHLFKTLLLMVSTHPHFIKQRNNLRCSSCNQTNDKGFTWYKKQRGVK